MGVNTIGNGMSDSLDIEVTAGPTLLSEFDGSEVVVVGQETRLSCQLECSPLCGLEWLMDGQNVHNKEGKFKVEEEIIEEDKEQNLFSGVKSTLSWTQLEKTLEEISVTCRATPRGEEPDIEYISTESSSNLRIEYPPVSIELNKELVEIEEGGEVESFECSSEARPPASIVWTKDGKEIAEGNQLSLLGPVSREQAGVYKCQARNVHGEAEAEL